MAKNNSNILSVAHNYTEEEIKSIKENLKRTFDVDGIPVELTLGNLFKKIMKKFFMFFMMIFVTNLCVAQLSIKEVRPKSEKLFNLSNRGYVIIRNNIYILVLNTYDEVEDPSKVISTTNIKKTGRMITATTTHDKVYTTEITETYIKLGGDLETAVKTAKQLKELHSNLNKGDEMVIEDIDGDAVIIKKQPVIGQLQFIKKQYVMYLDKILINKLINKLSKMSE